MSLILNIETSTNTCSVALSQNEELLTIKEAHNIQSHASLITVFIDEVLQNAKKKPNELEAVAVSIGPGSYTGLRIGLSCAKGLCFALNIPLIAVDSLESLVQGMICENFDKNGLYIPLIDARRDEVYYAIFDASGKEIVKSTPLILSENSFEDYSGKLYISGTGAQKTMDKLFRKNLFFLDKVNFSSKNMLKISNYFFQISKFADMAYLEPKYLKPFYSPKQKK